MKKTIFLSIAFAILAFTIAKAQMSGTYYVADPGTPDVEESKRFPSLKGVCDAINTSSVVDDKKRFLLQKMLESLSRFLAFFLCL